MTTATLTPFVKSEQTSTGRRTFRKQILPIGKINYKGRKINFDKPYLESLATAFEKRAYDQVPFVFADENNMHNEKPENFRGEVKGLELSDSGLDMVVQVTRKGAKALRNNPGLGVSARIVEGLEQSDGRTFPRAIRHVLATMNPRVTGLGGWQAVDLSGYDGADIEVVDLTAAKFEGKKSMAKAKGKGKKGGVVAEADPFANVDLSALNDDEFQALLDLAVQPFEVQQVVPNPEDDKGKKKKGAKVKNSKGRKPAKKKGDAPTDLSVANRARATNAVTDLRQMQVDLANDRWAGERDRLQHEGVPTHFLDLAEPILSQPEHLVLDLSAGDGDEKIDVAKTLRKMLKGARGLVDLSAPQGHLVDLSKDSKDPAKVTLDQWDKEYPA